MARKEGRLQEAYRWGGHQSRDGQDVCRQVRGPSSTKVWARFQG